MTVISNPSNPNHIPLLSIPKPKLDDIAIRLNALENAVKTKRVPLSVGGVILGNGTGLSVGGGLSMPDVAVADVTVNFNVPEDYVAGTDLVLELTWSTWFGNTGAVVFLNNIVYVHRLGATKFTVPAINPAVVDTSSVPASTMFRAAFIIEGTAGLQPGDAVLHNFFRNGTSVQDTSTDSVYVGGINLRYTASEQEEIM